MDNHITKNAYRILGLNTSASKREISRRTKEIQHKLKIDERPEYSIDCLGVDKLRNTTLVKQSRKKLSSPKQKIVEKFFWFSNFNEEIANLIEGEKYSDAINLMGEIVADGAVGYKNKALLKTLILFGKDDKSLAEESLSNWKRIISDDIFWGQFISNYRQHDETGISDKAVEAFKNNVEQKIADIYVDLTNLHDNDSYINLSSSQLSSRSEKAEKTIADPIYEEVINTVEALESMGISDDGVFDQQEVRELSSHIDNLQECFNTLIDKGLYEDTKTKNIRDRAAKAIREVVLDLHNNLHETEQAISLMKIAEEIAGTPAQTKDAKNEVEVLREVQQNESLLKPINALIEDNKFEQALEDIEVAKKENKDNKKLLSHLQTMEKNCISMMAIQKHKEAMNIFDGNDPQKSKPLFEEAGKLIYDNLDLFDFKKKAIDDLIDKVEDRLDNVTMNSIHSIDNYRNEIVQTAKESFAGRHEQYVLVVIVDAYLFSKAADLLKKERKRGRVYNILNVLGWLTIWFYGVGLIFFFAAWVYKNQS